MTVLPHLQKLRIGLSYFSSIKNANAQNLAQLKRVFEMDHLKIQEGLIAFN
jgi:hypothetical protein